MRLCRRGHMAPIVDCRDAPVPQRAHGTYCHSVRRAYAADGTRHFAEIPELRRPIVVCRRRACAADGTWHPLSFDETRLCYRGRMPSIAVGLAHLCCRGHMAICKDITTTGPYCRLSRRPNAPEGTWQTRAPDETGLYRRGHKCSNIEPLRNEPLLFLLCFRQNLSLVKSAAFPLFERLAELLELFLHC
ncbi:hypothetical protein Efla_004560 [Eimeria flavescens]